MIYPSHNRMIANPDYRVRVPHEPRRILARDGELCPLTVETIRAIKCGDVDTDPHPKPKAKKTKAKKE